MEDKHQLNITELFNNAEELYQSGMKAYEDKKYDDSIKYLNMFIDLGKGDLDRKISVCFYLSKCYFYQKKPQKRLQVLMKSFEFDVPRAEICCEMGYYFMDNNDFNKAVFWFEMAANLKIPVKPFDFFIEEYWGYLPHLQLCVCYDKLGNVEKAIQHNLIVSKYEPDLYAVEYNRKYFRDLCNVDEIEKIYLEKDLVKEKRNNYLVPEKEGVSVIVVTNKPKYIENIFKNYSRSSYNIKELIIILNNKNCNIQNYEAKAVEYNDVRTFSLDENCTLGFCLNFAIDKAKYNYISKMDDDDYYGENYITDLMNVFKYTDAEITGKRSHFVYFEGNKQLGILMPDGDNMNITYVAGATILAKKEVFGKVRFRNINAGEDVQFLSDCHEQGIKVYSSDKYNYVYMKHDSIQDHTWKIDSDEIQKWIRKLLITKDFKILSVV